MEPDNAAQSPKGKSKLKRARQAWSLYRWIDRLRHWHDWSNWIASFLHTKAGIAVALTSTAALTTAAVVTHNVIVDPYAAPYAPVKIEAASIPEPVRQTQSTQIFAIEGHDKQGRRGTFDVVVANKEFLWVRGSAEELEKAGQIVPGTELVREVFDDEVKAGLTSAREIIAVGTASQEGDPREETERAAKRARRTAELVAGVIDTATPVSSLNLGQYRERCATCDTSGTNWQRPFMVIAVKDLEDNANMREALADAMTGKDKLPSPASYSAFDLVKIR